MKKKIGFIGTGNMAAAIIDGILGSDEFEVQVSSRVFEKAKDFADARHIQAFETNADLAAASDIIVLAVKPHLIGQVAQEIDGVLEASRQVIVSIAAGLSLEELGAFFSHDQLPIVRVMPNLNVKIQQGASGIVANAATTDAQLAQVMTIFEGVGKVYQVPEAQFAAYTAIAGSSPAFVFQFIDAMSRAAVRHGIPKALATEIAAQAVAGSGALALSEGGNPWDLVDKVSSPGGTTVEGVLTLEKLGFYNAVVEAVDAVIEKDAKLSQK